MDSLCVYHIRGEYVCFYVSAFSLADSCYRKRLHSKLSQTKGNEKLENRTALAGLIWIQPKLHRDHVEL